MIDFKIQRGPSDLIFLEPGVINPRLIIEEGCWYLCTDTAELFLGVQNEDGLTLKQINEHTHEETTVDPEALSALRAEISEIKNSLTNYATEQYVIDTIENHEALAAVEEVKTKLEAEVLPIIPTVEQVETEIIPIVQELAETAATQEWVASQNYLQSKYEVLPVEGLLIHYRASEIRLNTQRVVPVHQTVGSTGNSNMYYVTFRAYAPEGATGVIESDGSQTDPEPTALSTDAYGRKYATIWSAIANYANGKWTKWGDSSTLDKYLGFYYTFKWFKEDILIGTDKVRVILTNDTCHDDLVPDAVARRIDEKVKAIEVPEISLDDYYNKTETESFVNETIAKIEHPTVNLEGYATEEFVRNEIANIEPPTVDTSNFVTTETLEGILATKADNILFTAAKFVKNPIGNFTENEDVSGLTLAELFAKLLGLSDKQDGSTDVSNTPIKDSIIENTLTIYQADDDGSIVVVPYKHIQFTATTAAKAPAESGFYEIVDEASGTITEYGYQHTTEPQNMFYMVALPSTVILGENADLMTWDIMSEAWVEYDHTTLTSDFNAIVGVLDENGLEAPIVAEGYTLWADLNETNPGRKYRIIIKEGV